MVFDFEAIIEGLGYLGVFMASLLGSVVPFLPAPYLVPVVVAITQLGLGIALVIALSAIGATIGKMVVFLASKAGRRLLPEDAKARMEPLQDFLLRRGWIAVFITASTPVPDDVVYIPLAIGGFGLFKFFVSLLAGKVVLTTIVAYSAIHFRDLFRIYVSESFTDFAIFVATAYLFLAVIVSYAFAKVDWRKVFPKKMK